MREALDTRVCVKAPSSRAQKDTTGDRRVGTRVSPCRGGPILGPQFSMVT